MKYIYSIVVVFLVIAYFIIYHKNENIEDFYGGESGPAYCDCNQRGQLGINACLSCNNCGWCTDPNGNGSCVLGDQKGPLFADCLQYSYNGGTAALPFPPMMMPWYQKFFMPWGGFVPPIFRGGRH